MRVDIPHVPDSISNRPAGAGGSPHSLDGSWAPMSGLQLCLPKPVSQRDDLPRHTGPLERHLSYLGGEPNE